MVAQQNNRHALLLWGSSLAYLLIGIEIVIMISPFAFYFYSVYGPALEFLSSSPYLKWTTEFFLPHMVFLDDPLVLGISYLQILFVIGLLLFFSAAIPLYYGRFTKKGVVRRGFYARIRHPQYLFLAISGFGLLLYWPRFIILIMYVSMLFVYYLLARHEEWRMALEAPGRYEEYMANTAMFIPGDPGGKIHRLLFGWLKPQWLGLAAAYLATLLCAILLAMGIRAYTINQLPTVTLPAMTLLPVFPNPPAEVAALYSVVQNSAAVQAQLQGKLAPNLIYIFPGDFFLTAIVTDQDRRWFVEDEITARVPEVFEWHQHKFRGGLGKFFEIFYNYFNTLGTVETDYHVERLVFMEIRDEQGDLASQRELFKLGARRTPVLIVDIDSEDHQVISVVKSSGAHKWGYLPMPTF